MTLDEAINHLEKMMAEPTKFEYLRDESKTATEAVIYQTMIDQRNKLEEAMGTVIAAARGKA